MYIVYTIFYVLLRINMIILVCTRQGQPEECANGLAAWQAVPAR